MYVFIFEKSYNFLLGLACHLMRPTAFTPKSVPHQPLLFSGGYLHVLDLRWGYSQLLGGRLTAGKAADIN